MSQASTIESAEQRESHGLDRELLQLGAVVVIGLGRLVVTWVRDLQ